MMSGLIHVIYNSSATIDFSDEQLGELLRSSRDANVPREITGMLLYVDGSFFQVLERPEAAVDALVETISRDSRHTRVTTIIRKPIATRSFGEWTMGFTRISQRELGEIDGLNDFFGDGRVVTDLDGGRAKKLLTAFKQGRWRARLTSRPYANTAPTLASERPEGERPTVSRPDFSFAFQPIIDARQHTVVGYEALVRGHQQQPSAYVLQKVPLAEIAVFDDDARRAAVGLAARIGFNGNLHLNFLPQTRVVLPKTIDDTLEMAARSGVGASRIVLEIKHEASEMDAVELAEWLRPYRQMGMRISIDDFGSGHAGLALLEHYQPNMISVSMPLVRGVDGNGPRQAIMRGLLQTCGDLGIDVVAKGVEIPEEYFWLREEGVELFQGFLFAKSSFEAFPRPMFPAFPD